MSTTWYTPMECPASEMCCMATAALLRQIPFTCMEEDTCMPCEEEDTCMPYEEEDTCMSYEEEDTCMSYEEEDTCMTYEEKDTCMTHLGVTQDDGVVGERLSVGIPPLSDRKSHGGRSSHTPRPKAAYSAVAEPHCVCG